MRLDVFLTEKNSISRTRAKNLIELNKVSVNGSICAKPAQEVRDTDIVEITEDYEASLGGIKLKEAIDTFSVDIDNKLCLDVGSSNGGFCDVLLSKGAKNVIALDVGECALPDRLIKDNRIIVMDRTNAKFLSPDKLPYIPEIITIDVSFISLTQILPPLYPCLNNNGTMICLIKPQFECGKKALSKKGIVINKKEEEKAIKKVSDCASSLGYSIRGICNAPHPFVKKNQEFFIILSKILA